MRLVYGSRASWPPPVCWDTAIWLSLYSVCSWESAVWEKCLWPGKQLTGVNYFHQPPKSDILGCAYWHHVWYGKIGFCIRDVTVSLGTGESVLRCVCTRIVQANGHLCTVARMSGVTCLCENMLSTQFTLNGQNDLQIPLTLLFNTVPVWRLGL